LKKQKEKEKMQQTAACGVTLEPGATKAMYPLRATRTLAEFPTLHDPHFVAPAPAL
jgi:hypothetical protein